MRRTSHAVSTCGVVLLVIAGCHRAKPVVAIATPPLHDEHCWWAVNRTAYPLDTVVDRFTRGLMSVGFSHPVALRVADTAWINARPTPLPAYGGAAVGARVAAYQDGDSTHYRIFVAMPDSSGSQTITLCHQISIATPVAGFALKEPDGEEKLSVWRRRQ